MSSKLLGLFPVLKADGEDITRADTGLLHSEVIWLPAVLLGTGVTCTNRGDHDAVATFDAHGERSVQVAEISLLPSPEDVPNRPRPQ